MKSYIKNCLKCIEFAPLIGKSEGYLHAIPKGDLPFQTYHINHYGLLQKTGEGYKYILSIVDGLTKFIRLYPCRSTSANESIKYVKEYFRCYSKLRRLVSDRGSAFMSEEFKNFIKQESINHVLIAVGMSHVNGQVERLNSVLTSMITKFSDSQKKWD